MRVGFLVSHPIQYYAPIFRELAKRCDLTVYFAHRQSAEQQAKAGFGVAFEWDIDLLSGYEHRFLTNIARRPSTDTFWGCNTPDINREVADGRYDAFVVPGWALRSYLQAISACRRARLPVFVRGDSQLGGPRGTVVRLAKAVAFSSLLRRFDGYLYVGQRNREYLLHHGARPERMFFSPHCVDNAWFKSRSEAARLARAAQQSPVRRILFVGKLVNRKRPLDVVQAAALVRTAGQSVELVFAGAGDLQETLDRAARAADLPTKFLGFVNQSQMPAVYASADVVVLPSDGSETWGLAINEAMACGVPAVVSEAVGCGPDLIEEHGTGAAFPLGDAPAMAEAIKEVLTFDRQHCRARLAARIEQYSPRAAAEGVLEAANRLYRRRLLQ